MDYMKKWEYWLSSPVVDEKTKEELKKLSEKSQEIEERFYKELEFGTAGLRGVIGMGTNRMNKYTVGKATQGLAEYIIEKGGQEKGVAIAYDSRHMSVEFSEQAALILNANGIKTYRFESLRPTPELSFTVRELNCISGIVITASHNPPKYNGYKVYWEDGAQIVAPHDKKIIEEMSRNNEKQIAEMEKHNEIQAYQLQELTKQVEKHNKVIERVYQLETDEAVMKKELKVANHRIDDLEKFHK